MENTKNAGYEHVKQAAERHAEKLMPIYESMLEMSVRAALGKLTSEEKRRIDILKRDLQALDN